jgi:hypothetical protein
MKIHAALAALLLAACSSQSAAPSIKVSDAWSRATVARQTSGAVYLVLANGGGEDRLVSVATPAGDASIHSSSTEGGVMRMRPLHDLPVPANSTVELKSGGTHIMIMGLKAPLAAGSSFPLDLKFDKSGQMRVTVKVRPATANGATM